ncbi:hypothetical protein LLH23_00925 [bacterium]|nr:hypothetical protein [bacterium]
MLPAGAFAVVLMLGGAQVMLPAPAFVQQGRVWAPAREVLQRLGYHVRWQPSPRALIATRDSQSLTFPELPPPWPTPTTADEARYVRRLGNLLYLPLLALRALDLRTTWDAGARRVTIRDPAPMPVTLATILNSPAQWLDRTVTLAGEYLGWDAYPFCYATRPGPPVASGDWVLGGADGAIYCTPAPIAATFTRTGLATVQPAGPVLTPYAALGRRISVTGRVALAPSGVPYLRHESVTWVTGRAGVSCELVLNQQARAAGERLGWELVIHNPGPTILVLPQSKEMLVSVAAPGGALYVSKQSLPDETTLRELAPEAEQRLPGAWPIPTDAPAGTYAITVSLAEGLQSMARRFEVVRPVRGEAP